MAWYVDEYFRGSFEAHHGPFYTWWDAYALVEALEEEPGVEAEIIEK